MQVYLTFLLVTMLLSGYVRSYKRICYSSIGETKFRMLTYLRIAADKVITLEPSNKMTSNINPLFSQESVPLQSLIHLPSLKQVIFETAFQKASAIQQHSYEPIFAGKDVIVGAETGSGKTLAYFLPLVDRYLSLKADMPAAVDKSADSWEEAADKLLPNAGPQVGIILAPSNPLCDQVMSMVSPLVNKLKEDGVSVRLSKLILDMKNNTILMPINKYYRSLVRPHI
ncbi:DEAD/DEAH box helicase [archaeon]|nr:MAG: DEAD/DEAH box helicase [archaeon]